MTLLFRDSDDNALSVYSVASAGYSVADSELWFSCQSGVCVSFYSVSQHFAELALSELADGFLDLSCCSFRGVVYG